MHTVPAASAVLLGRAFTKSVRLSPPSPTKLRLAMAERYVRSRPGEMHMKDWLVPPVLFPIFLVLLIAGYAILRTPT